MLKYLRIYIFNMLNVHDADVTDERWEDESLWSHLLGTGAQHTPDGPCTSYGVSYRDSVCTGLL